MESEQPSKVVIGLMVIAVLFALIPNAALVDNVLIKNVGTLAVSITARSGSAADIQTAVNTISSVGGGIVYIPAGTFYWNGETVTIPGGVSVIGAGLAGCQGHEANWANYTAVTILHENHATPDMFSVVGAGSGYRPVRISGIQFEVSAPANSTIESSQIANGVRIQSIYNFRIDHCTFVNFWNIAVLIDANNGNSSNTCYGVIDHCVCTDPYKLNNPGSPGWAWGYGFYCRGTAANHLGGPNWVPPGGWDLPITSFFGQYGARPGYAMMFVEDCHFSYCRHCTDAIQGGYVVNRYNLMEKPSCVYWIGMSDVHGNLAGGYGPGGRGQECYNNIFKAWPLGEIPSWLDPDCSAFQLRGGAGLCYNNTYTGNGKTGEYAAFATLSMGDDPNGAYWNNGMDINQTYIWANTYTNTRFIVVDWRNASYIPTENVNYFLRAPSQAQDGFTYTPYAYPHPLTLQG